MSREVLSPPLQRMSNNRCYRINVVHEDFDGNKWNSAGKMRQQKITGYTEHDLYGEDDFEDDVAVCNIKELHNGRYMLSLSVPKAFYGGIIGHAGITKRRIETETQTEIAVPRQNEKHNQLTIKAKERSHICSALRKLRLLIDGMRRRMRPTHFLAVPLNSGEVQQNFLKLKQNILDAQLPGINEELFISENRIHLTLGVYILLDDDERHIAIDELQKCTQFLAELTTPFELKIQGLEIMNDDPSAVNVVYARVEAPQLQKFADSCLKHFQATGLTARDNNTRDNIKLHMTVLNQRYRKQSDAKAGPPSFDARELLKRFGQFDLGQAQCNEVRLCVLNSSEDSEPDGFYKTSSSLKF